MAKDDIYTKKGDNFNLLINALDVEKITINELPFSARNSIDFALQVLQDYSLRYEDTTDFYKILTDKVKNNLRVIKAAIERDSEVLMLIPEKLQRNETFFIAYLKSCHYLTSGALSLIRKYYLDNENVVEVALPLDYEIYESIDERLRKKKELFLNAMKYGLDYPNRYHYFKDDNEIVIKIIEWLENKKKTCHYLEKVDINFVSENLLCKKEVFIRLMNLFPSITNRIPSNLYQEKEVMIAAIRLNNDFFKRNIDICIKDNDYIIEGLKTNSTNFSLLPKSIQTDYNLFLKILIEVDFNPEIDIDILFEESKNHVNINDIIKYAPDSYFSDNKFIEILLTNYPDNYDFLNSPYYDKLNETLKNEKSVILNILKTRMICKYDSYEQRYFIQEDKDKRTGEWYYANVIAGNHALDKEINYVLIKNNPNYLYIIHDTFRDDKELVRLAVSGNSNLFRFASKRLTDDIRFVREILSGYIYEPIRLYKWCSEKVRRDEIVVSRIIKSNPTVLTIAPDEVKTNSSLVQKAIERFLSPPKGNAYPNNDEIESFLEKIGIDFIGLESLVNLLSQYKIRYKWLLNLKPEFVNRQEIISPALKQDIKNLNYFPEGSLCDESLILELIAHNSKDIDFILSKVSQEIKQDITFIKRLVNNNSRTIEFIDKYFRDNEEIVSIACKSSVSFLKYASSRLLNDFDFINRFFREDIYLYVGEALRKNKSFIISCIKNNHDLTHFNEDSITIIKNDLEAFNEFCHYILRMHSSGYSYSKKWGYPKNLIEKNSLLLNASSEIMDDYNAVLLATLIDLNNFQFVAEKIKDNILLVQALFEDILSNRKIHLQNNKGISLYNLIPYNLKNDKNIVLSAIRENPSIYLTLTPELKEDFDVVNTLMTINPDYFIHLPNYFRDNEGIVKQAIGKNYKYYDLVSERLKNKKDIISIYLKSAARRTSDENILLTTNPKFRNDKDIVFLALNISYKNIKHISKAISNDKNFFIEVINWIYSQYSTPLNDYDKEVLKYCSLGLRNDKDFIRLILKRNANANFKYLSKNLQDNLEIIIYAIEEGSLIYDLVPKKWKNNLSVLSTVIRNYKSKDLKSLTNQIPKRCCSKEPVIFDLLRKEIEIQDQQRSFNKRYYIFSTFSTKKQNRSADFLNRVLNLYNNKSFTDDYFLIDALVNVLKIRNNYSLIKNILSLDGKLYNRIPKRYQKDNELIKTSILSRSVTVKEDNFYQQKENKLLQQIINNKELAIFFMRNGGDFSYLQKKYADSKEVVIEAVKFDWKVLNFISRRLINDFEVLDELISNHDVKKLKAKELLILCSNLNKEILANRNFAKRLVTSNGLFLEFLPASFQNDKEIVWAAVRQNGASYSMVNKRLRKSRRLLVEALKTDIHAIRHAPNKLREDRNFNLKLLNVFSCYEGISEKLKADVAFKKFAPKTNEDDYDGDDCDSYDSPSYEKYGGAYGYDDLTIDVAFEGDPENSWNVD